jgi:hypothetical protein
MPWAEIRNAAGEGRVSPNLLAHDAGCCVTSDASRTPLKSAFGGSDSERDDPKMPITGGCIEVRRREDHSGAKPRVGSEGS